ncbi:MAG: tRNA (guanosine(46)-N7)-methyltransferase TrmB [Chlamydiales bacterium]
MVRFDYNRIRVKTAKDLIIPFVWADRRPVWLDRFFYVPASYPYGIETVPFFEKEQPIVIEYCSGNGQWIGEKAKQNPERNFLAVEKRFERARLIWLKSHRENLPNLAVACAEGLIFTRYYAPKTEEIFVNFPDPWPKLRHAKHRLIRSEFVRELLKVVSSGGRATCVTDDSNYASQIAREFGSCPEWKSLFHVGELSDYGGSFFNDLWKRRGRSIHYLSYERI